MHGEIKLKRWLPFSAKHVIRHHCGMVWKAGVRMFGLPIRGSDRLIDCEGAMLWKLYGLIPIMRASNADITRSAVGRVEAKLVWLPSAICAEDTAWTQGDSEHAQARITVASKTTEVDFGIDNQGQLKTVDLQRWSNSEGAQFHNVDFGGIAEHEKTLGGYTILATAT